MFLFANHQHVVVYAILVLYTIIVVLYSFLVSLKFTVCVWIGFIESFLALAQIQAVMAVVCAFFPRFEC